MTRTSFVLALVSLVTVSATLQGAIVFDDFNVNEGHFGFAPSFSATSVGESSLSTADRVVNDGPFEGAGHQKLVLAHDGSTTKLRIRHVSGGPPYTSTQSANPVYNITFNTSSGTDGWIGFYAKASGVTGWQVALALDDSSNASAGMDMGTPKSLIADGQWHLYEWNLDDNAQWDAASGAGGDGTIQNGQHSIDSIYFFANETGINGQLRPPVYIDFVAKSDSGSIAALVAVPEASSFLAVGLASLASLGVVWFRGKRAKAA